MMPSMLEARSLGKRYGARWALKGCTFEVPRGTITALVGPNGAGKSTLLHLAIGLSEPTEGSIEISGASARRHPLRVLPKVGFVAQGQPLEGSFTVEEMFHFGRALNPHWDDQVALDAVARLDIPLRQRVRTLSGGERAQVALALALAKRPEFLILDEPAAALDPLARREFLQSLLQAAADQELTVLFSSHLVDDLERACDYLVILGNGRVQLADRIERVLDSHRRLVGGADATLPGSVDVVQERRGERQTSLIVHSNQEVFGSDWGVSKVGLEDIVLAYLDRARHQGAPR